jgi:hypothetical protein
MSQSGEALVDRSENVLPESVRRAIVTLLRELVDGPPGKEAYILNAGDRGLLASLDRLSAAAASARPDGRASIAAHTDHVRYGLELFNRWTRGENPWQDANWASSWQRQTVTDEGWASLRAALRKEAHDWTSAAGVERPLDAVALAGTIASVAHLAYHLGAIRQLSREAAGPPEPQRN